MSASSSSASGSRVYAEQVSRQYEVPRAMTKERVKEFAVLGERRINELIRWVTDDDQGVEGSVAASAVLRQQKENFTVYEMHDDRDELLVMKGVVRLQNTTCDEVLALLSGRTAVEVDAFLQDLLGAQYAAGQALHYTEVDIDAGNAPEPPEVPTPTTALQSPRGTRPTTSSLMVQWLALNDVHPQAPLREFFFMRFNQTFCTGSGGNNPLGGGASYGVSVMESLELPRCGPIFSQTHMQRHPLHKCGFVVEASEDKSSTTTRVSFFVTAPYSAPSLEQDRAWLLRLAGCVRLVPSALVNRRIRRNQLRDRRSWHFRDTCSVCAGGFSMFTRRAHHCRICGSAVCSKCSAIRKDAQRSKFAGSTRVCMACLNGDQNGPNGASSATYDTRSGASRPSASEGASSRGSDSECFGSSAHVTVEEACAGFSIEPTLAANLPTSPSSTSSSGLSQGGKDDGDVFANSPYDYELTFTKGNVWPDAPLTSTEDERVQIIQRLNLSQDFANAVLRDLLDLARTTVNCPVAALSVVTKSTSLFVTTVGLVGDQVPRDIGVDAHALMSHEPLVVLDCRKDLRFAKNPLALSMQVQFFLGVPMIAKDSGVVVGALCMADKKARKKVKGSDLRALQLIASRTMDKMDAQNTEATEKITDGVKLL
uniref:FYVE-type domain-containing protein n=1 Tax=Hyaloperonospora arabidopsidis (strain Emoy2) TaxID=559515 RepID=M4B1M5_HYAAE